MKDLYRLLADSVLGGICIAIGGVVYLKVGGVAGAILFGFGLLAVVHYGFKLYTGVSGFVPRASWTEFRNLIVILGGNIIGCWLLAAALKYSAPALMDTAVSVYTSRLALGWTQCALLGAGCGFIMTTAVRFGREGRWLPLLFGVPVFILCGFLHSIADAFYISMLPSDFFSANFSVLAVNYLAIVLGNFVGCNLTRLLRLDSKA